MRFHACYIPLALTLLMYGFAFYKGDASESKVVPGAATLFYLLYMTLPVSLTWNLYFFIRWVLS